MMRVPWVLLAVAATLALAGCSSQPDSPVDPESVDAADYEVPLLLLGIAIIVGVVLLAINLTQGNSSGSPPPPAAPAQTWQHAEDEVADDDAADEEPAPRKSPRAAAAPPARRRRAP